MVNYNLIRNLDEANEAELNQAVEQAFQGLSGDLDEVLTTAEEQEVLPGKIVVGKIIRVEDDRVVVDVGYKCEGVLPIGEWDEHDPPVVGQEVRLLVEDIEEAQGTSTAPEDMLLLSKRKAEKMLRWQELMETIKEGDVVTGRVTRKIKGGLLVDIGVNVFLPASQVDIRRPHDIGDYIGRWIQCVVLKIDDSRRNIVVSRRALIEEERAERKKQLLKVLKKGEIRKGIVKNIADFGAFVDLGGIDGLLHITDMSWGRVNHPSDMVSLDQEIEVMILDIDYEREKIALGLKQKEPSPWDNIEEKYPIGSRVKGEVVNVMSYGAFVKLEEGIEGLVHISEMSWTRRISDPTELVNKGDIVEVVVLDINKEKQEISLGMKQTQENPWDKVEEKYPVGSVVTGTVRNLTNYGAFVELEEGIDGLLHVNDMSWTRKIGHPGELLQKGQQIQCKVLNVDKQRRRISLGLKQLSEDPWVEQIPNKYKPGQVVTGTVTKITNFGVFVSLEDDLEGLLHISELADHKVENPEEVVKVGDQIEVKILRVDPEERKIGLSRKRVEWAEDMIEEQAAPAETKPAGGSAPQELKGGVGQGGGPLFQASLISQSSAETKEEAKTAEAPAETSAPEPSEAQEAAPAAEAEPAPAAEEQLPSAEEQSPEPQATQTDEPGGEEESSEQEKAAE